MRLEFTSEAQIKKTVVKSYVEQAIAVEKAGLSVPFKAKHECDQAGVGRIHTAKARNRNGLPA